MAVYLTDFGLALHRSGAPGSGMAPPAAGQAPTRLTLAGQLLGTPAYLSPEQALGDGSGAYPVGTYSDVWALGAVLYECCTGRREFEGVDAPAIVGAVLQGVRPDPRRTRADLPYAVVRLLDGCQERDPRWRLPDGEAVADACRHLLAGERLTLPADRRRRAWVGLIASGVAILALGTFLALRGARPSPPRTADGPDAAVQAAQAWQTRQRDPAGAARTIADLLAQEPGRDDWRVWLGVCHWTAGELPAARAAWRAVPPAAAEHREARWLLGIARLLDRPGPPDRIARARAHLTAAATGADEVAACAHALLAWLDADGEAARQALGARAGWRTALTRATVSLADATLPPASVRTIMEAALAAGFEFPWIHHEIAQAYRHAGDLGQARKAFDRALQLAPGMAEARINRTYVLAALGDLASAAAAADALVAEHADVRSYTIRAYVRRLQGDATGARADCDAAIAADATYPEALHLRALLSLDAQAWEAALADIDAVLAHDPNNVEARYNRATALAAMGRTRDALTEFDAVVDVQPQHWKARLNRALARHALGDPDGALADLDAAVEAQPREFDPIYNRALVHQRAGRLDAALTDLDRAETLSPDAPELWTARATVLYDARRLPEALAAFDRALQLAPEDASAWCNRALVRHQAGQVDGAAADLHQATRLRPDWPRPWQALAELEAMRKRWPEALAAARTLVRVGADAPNAEEYRALLAAIEELAAGN